jgi:hypothetical protein
MLSEADKMLYNSLLYFSFRKQRLPGSKGVFHLEQYSSGDILEENYRIISRNSPFFLFVEEKSCWVLGCMRIFGVTVLGGARFFGLVVRLIVSFGEGWGFRLLASRTLPS